jgi:hypothetical protein
LVFTLFPADGGVVMVLFVPSCMNEVYDKKHQTYNMLAKFTSKKHCTSEVQQKVEPRR